MERYFLPYDMSVKLKEKGLNIPFYFFYRTDDVDKQIHHSTSINALEYSNKIIDDEVVIAPMYQQVFDWIRNEKNIDIEIDASINIFGNLFAFMPLALFLPKLIPFVDKWYKHFLVVSLFIILIEIMQFVLDVGSLDIDDYILNIVGSMLCYIIFNIKKINKFINKFLFL